MLANLEFLHNGRSIIKGSAIVDFHEMKRRFLLQLSYTSAMEIYIANKQLVENYSVGDNVGVLIYQLLFPSLMGNQSWFLCSDDVTEPSEPIFIYVDYITYGQYKDSVYRLTSSAIDCHDYSLDLSEKYMDDVLLDTYKKSDDLSSLTDEEYFDYLKSTENKSSDSDLTSDNQSFKLVINLTDSSGQFTSNTLDSKDVILSSMGVYGLNNLKMKKIYETTNVPEILSVEDRVIESLCNVASLSKETIDFTCTDVAISAFYAFQTSVSSFNNDDPSKIILEIVKTDSNVSVDCIVE